MSDRQNQIIAFWAVAVSLSLGALSATSWAGNLDIYEIQIISSKYWSGGVFEDYGIYVTVSGSNDINAVTLTPPAPANSPIVFDQRHCWEGGCIWAIEIEEYNSLDELRNDFPTGDYTFSFNNGADSATLNHNPIQPTGFAVITYPADDGATDVPLNPTITWQSCVGYGDAVAVYIWDEMRDTRHWTGFIDIAQTSWMAGPLGAAHLHELEAVVFDGTASLPYSRATFGGDSFIYTDLFEYENSISFTTTGTPAPSPPFFQSQIVPYLNPDADFVFIKDVNGVNSWAGEDYGAVRLVGVLNDNEQSQGLVFPADGFHGSQGVVLVYDVNDESINGSLCALSSAFPAGDGGPGGSGLPTNLNDAIVQLKIDFSVPGSSSVQTLSNALGFWLAEEDGDTFETPGLFDITKGWRTYSYELNDLANYMEFPYGGGIFGDSPATLLAISFEDPGTPQGIDTIVYFIDDFLVTGGTTFFEDFEARCSPSNEADLNGDCTVDFRDFAVFAENWLWQAD
ncbi:MAG: hypothetical protein KAY65_05185 [Planctomycetes bacterium]|nr:hypothetical protein [Planctomycetota bacterium]